MQDVLQLGMVNGKRSVTTINHRIGTHLMVPSPFLLQRQLPDAPLKDPQPCLDCALTPICSVCPIFWITSSFSGDEIQVQSLLYLLNKSEGGFLRQVSLAHGLWMFR